MSRPHLSRRVRAGLLTGVTDGLFATVLSVVFYQSTFGRLWRGVASTLLGREALDGGIGTIAVGLLAHFGVAFGWSAVFLLLAGVSWVRRLLLSHHGVIKVAHGPFIWLVMSLGVIPLLTHRPPAIGLRWWIQLVGHVPFVGIPIVWSIRGASRTGGAGRERPA